ncbi:helix-turn-helix domain-containing protein [Vagococcus fluvialis]|uniref:Mga helix-turn-helix domain-containing protein n=1 Tax=Vagococcus fluvialis TaxID=2738 RepID=A0A7X6D9Z7_9ENTE|nr:helix-turn-helix domain-containing protein [Vagococcus fluvialis]NKC68536.1 hypothetical protein [Vagococcus fluvialis]
MEKFIKNILSNKNYNLVSLVEYLLIQDRWCNIYEISQHLNCSERNVRRYIDELSCILERKKDDSIILKRNQRVKLELSSDFNIRSVTNIIFKEDYSVKLLETILLQKYKNINILSQKENMSENNIKYMIKNINIYLKTYDIEINSSKLTFKGKESSIRIFFYIFIWYLYKDHRFISSEIFLYNELKISINTLCLDLHLNLNYIKQKELVFMLFVSITRYNNKCHFNDYEILKKYLIPYEYCTFYDKFIELYSRHKISNDMEVSFFYLIFILRKYFDWNSIQNKMVYDLNKLRNTAAYLATENLMITLSQEHVLSTKIERQFKIELLFLHIYCDIFKNVDFYFNEDNTYIEFSDIYVRYNSYISKLLSELYESTKLPLFLETKILRNKYFYILSQLIGCFYFEKKILITIMTDLPRNQHRILEDIIYDKLKILYNIEIIELDTFNDYEVDIIITNIINEEINDIPSVSINVPLQKNDLNKIESVVRQINFEA